MLRKDASCVSFKGWCSVDSTSHGSSSVHLCLDFISATDNTILPKFPSFVSLLSPAIRGISWFGRHGWSAILAFLHCRAGKLFWVASFIGLTSFFWNTVFPGKDENLQRISSVTAAACEAVDQHLRRQGHVWPSSVPNNINTIGN